ncbi:MAG: DUF4446 family protein [Armatimonadetes bacterium]|jgi:hypothetical protein|nr:DUF4446 family protein [Armatimonadota bacterium]
MREVADFLQANDAYFLLGLSVLSLFLLIFTVALWRKLAGLNRRRNKKLEDGRIDDIIEYLNTQADALDEIREKLDYMNSIQAEQARALVSCVSNIGLVRFNAFDDVGGEQSFAVVLLDKAKNGVAFSSLYGRQDARVYAKAICAGQGERPLSTEEQQALSKALERSDAAALR